MKKKLKHIVTLLSLSVLSLMIIVAFSSSYGSDVSYSDRIYVKAFYPDKALAHKMIRSFQPAPPEVNYEEGYLVMSVTYDDMVDLQAEGFVLEEYPGYDPKTDRSAYDLQRAGIPGYSCYPTVEETFQTAQNLVAQYPELATWVDAGDSWKKTQNQGGYDMMVLVLTNKNSNEDKSKLFITGALHAREYTTSPLALTFAQNLLNDYETDADARMILDYNEVHLMLHANPDGRKKAEGGKSWRKNANSNYCYSNSNYQGADLNRNFDFEWNTGGSSSNQCDETYMGPRAASEPETQAIQSYMDKIFTDNNGSNPNAGAPDDASGLYIDIHSYSELVLWPWGNTSQVAPNGVQMQTLGRKFAYWNGYKPEQAVGLYPTSGTTDDYGYGELGVASYCFELGTSFFQSCSVFENQILPDNLPALEYAAKTCRRPYMWPSGPDVKSASVSGYTLTAQVTDTQYNNSNGSEPTQNIAAVEYYIDTPPWKAGAVAHAMSASDGSFNSKTETATAVVDLTGLSAGKHLVFVRAKDTNGNWGAPSAAFIEITATPTPTPTATPSLSNVALGKPVTASGQFSSEFPKDAINDGDMNTVWGSKYNAGPQWVFIDLGSEVDIDQVVIHYFNPYYSPYYHVGISNDAATWEFAATETNGNGGADQLSVKRKARYVGLYLTRGPKLAYGIKELQVLSYVMPATPTPTATVPPTPTPDGNLIKNGDFSQGMTYWEGYVDPTASGIVVVENDMAVLRITTAGADAWTVQLMQVPIPYINGQTYTVAFDAKASSARTMEVIAGMSAEPYLAYGQRVINLSTTMQRYSFTFTMTSATDNNAVIEFDCGDQIPTVYIDNVYVGIQ